MKQRNNVYELNEKITAAVKENGEIAEIIGVMNFEEIKAQSIMAAASPDYVKALFGYIIPEKFVGGVKELTWALTALEAVLPEAEKLPPAQKADVYEHYITLLTIYVSNVYNPALLTPEESRFLPEERRFGYFVFAARQCLENGDKAGAVKNLKAALEADKTKAKIVGALIDGL